MKIRILLASTLILFAFKLAFGQSFMVDIQRDSARSDIRTGGKIEKTDFTAGESNLKMSVNVPAFQLTLWQNGKEIKNYPIGVGLKEYPIFVGIRDIRHIIWNPIWIPPEADWVAPPLRGQIIQPTDPRNPLGKIKIPLGYGYLIHQAKGTQDLGNLVSHGCVRVLRNDLYDLNEKIVSAFSLDVSPENIKNAKRTKETLVIELGETSTLPIEVTYDTIVIEAGNLHIYPDVYGYNKNTVGNLRAELKANGIDDAKISVETLEKMLGRVKNKTQYVVSLEKIRAGNYLDGKTVSVLEQKAKSKKRKGRSGKR